MGNKASQLKKSAGRILTRKKTKEKNPHKKLVRKKTEIITHGIHSITGVDPNNPDKVNQDRIIYRMEFVQVPQKYAGEEGPGVQEMVKLVGVCDGHGKHGHEVAQYVADHLPTLLFDTMKNEFRRGLNTVEAVLEESIRNICKMVDKSEINTQLSGCTLLICFIFEEYLYTCHLGDSRAVLARDNDGHLAASPLSIDHIPERDRQRIESFGGLVSTNLVAGKPTKPMLVGKLDEEGLDGAHFSIETSRAIGDKVARKFGLSHKPDITKKRLDGDDMFIILASDGAVQVVFNGLRQKKTLDTVATGLCQKAKRMWKESEDRVDDISCVIALLQENLDTHSFFQMGKFESFISVLPMLEPSMQSPSSSPENRQLWAVRELTRFKKTVEMEPTLSRAQSHIFDDGYEFSVNMNHYNSAEAFEDWFSENRIASTRVNAVSVDFSQTRVPLGSISRRFSDSGAGTIPRRMITETYRAHSIHSDSADFYDDRFGLPVVTPHATETSFELDRAESKQSLSLDFLEVRSMESPDLQARQDTKSSPVESQGSSLKVHSEEKRSPGKRSPGRGISPSASPDPNRLPDVVCVESEVFETPVVEDSSLKEMESHSRRSR